ncbi:hypothetical protein [Paenibacillus dakarensis]|uniref:hypothetical protein n=1 Tax=Paenibacillus dakarensis TaxID=1527293 RepID=UPI000A6E16A1|nr:hypothetical protein [Paenibacillus dakarensis]
MTAPTFIYVLLTDTGTLFTRMIKSYTSAPYNHASIALDEELTEVYSFGRKTATNPWLAGFVREDINEGVYRHFPLTRCSVLRLRVTEEQRADLKRILQQYEMNREHYRYNLLGLFFLMIKVNYAPKNAYFCSQFVAEMLRGMKVELWNRPSALVTPHDFLIHPEFECIYEGLLNEYPVLLSRRDSDDKMCKPEDLLGHAVAF